MDDYSHDYLLDKRVKIFQPLNGYRASTDAVLLSSMIGKIKKGESILDVGSGTGAISLCLASRFAEKQPLITGLELQPELAELSNLSAKANGFDSFLKYVNCDIKNKPQEIKNCSFNHVISNPPYSESDMPSPNKSKALAHNHNNFSLQEWIAFCIKMIAPLGHFYMINRAEALDEILAAIHGKLGHIEVIPLFSKSGQNAKRVIVRAQKDNHTPTKIHSGLIIHEDNGEYTQISHQILRLGKSFDEL